MHIYSDRFFDYIDRGARRSARTLIGHLAPWLGADSILDIGCGRGVWLDEWRSAGATEVMGVDGPYVDRDRLAIPREAFAAADLTRPLYLERRFELAQCLEVGEHLPKAASTILVDSLTRHSDRVLFSAAVPGQGGEFHVNEQPLAFWQALFADRGYTAFDCLRPVLAQAAQVEPWYRYNSVLYVNAAGRAGLPEEVLSTELAPGEALSEGGSLGWRMRRALVRHLPVSASTKIAQARAAVIAARAKRADAVPAAARS